MIPAFDRLTGQLPPGEHEATWTEIYERFGWNARRTDLLAGLRAGLEILAAAGCERVWLNGSFVTTKDEPGDFDCAWAPAGVDRVVLLDLGPELLDLSDHRAAQKRRFGGEFLPNIVERSSGAPFTAFFQTDRDGKSKGVVVIDPRQEEW